MKKPCDQRSITPEPAIDLMTPPRGEKGDPQRLEAQSTLAQTEVQ